MLSIFSGSKSAPAPAALLNSRNGQGSAQKVVFATTSFFALALLTRTAWRWGFSKKALQEPSPKPSGNPPKNEGKTSPREHSQGGGGMSPVGIPRGLLREEAPITPREPSQKGVNVSPVGTPRGLLGDGEKITPRESAQEGVNESPVGTPRGLLGDEEKIPSQEGTPRSSSLQSCLDDEDDSPRRERLNVVPGNKSPQEESLLPFQDAPPGIVIGEHEFPASPGVAPAPRTFAEVARGNQ